MPKIKAARGVLWGLLFSFSAWTLWVATRNPTLSLNEVSTDEIDNSKTNPPEKLPNSTKSEVGSISDPFSEFLKEISALGRNAPGEDLTRSFILTFSRWMNSSPQDLAAGVIWLETADDFPRALREMALNNVLTSNAIPPTIANLDIVLRSKFFSNAFKASASGKFFGRAVKADPGAAFEDYSSHPEELVRRNILDYGNLGVLSELGSEKAITMFESVALRSDTPPSPLFAEQYVKLELPNPARLAKHNNPNLNSFLKDYFGYRLLQDMNSALRWFESSATEFDQNLRNQMLAWNLGSVAKWDKKAALDWAKLITDGELKELALRQISEAK